MARADEERLIWRRCRVLSRSLMLASLCGVLFLAAVVRGAEPAKAWQWRRAVAPKAVLAEGVWSEYFKVREALHTAGIPFSDGYVSMSGYWGYRSFLLGIPKNEEFFRSHSVIVVANVAAEPLSGERLAIIERFVGAGGGLVVLGGHWSYQGGGYANTVLAKVLPVTWKPQSYLKLPADARVLAPAAKPTIKLDYNFKQKPRAFYGATLAPKRGATVQVLMGRFPAVVSGSYGKGRVVACALAPNGAPGKGELAYWDWPDWPRLLGSLIDWAGGARPPNATIGAKVPARMSAEAIFDLQLEPRRLTANEVQRITRGLDAAAADALLEVLCEDDMRQFGQLPQVAAALYPHVKKGWSKRLAKLAAADNPDFKERGAALRLLGACRTPGDYGVLVTALRDDNIRVDALIGISCQRNPKARALLQKTLATALKACQSTLYPGRFDPNPFAWAQAPTVLASAAGLAMLSPREELPRFTEICRKIRFYRRVFANAAKRRVADTDKQGQAIRKRIIESAAKLRRQEQEMQDLAARILRARPRETAEYLRNLSSPEDVLFFARIVDGQGGHLPAVDLRALTKAQAPMIRRVAQAWLKARKTAKTRRP